MINFNDYEKILIGIGDYFNTAVPEGLSEFDKYAYVKSNFSKDTLDLYNKLSNKLKDRDYYVITTCTDDVLFKSNLDNNRIVAPCGGFRYLQCPDNCSQELLPFEEGMSESIVCPHCSKNVVFNRLPIEHYNEGGYMEEWQEYNKWLQSTINKKLLIIELGVGMAYPSVIRFAFEKLTHFNNKAKMYRVHSSLAFATPEIKDKCECIMTDPMEYLRELC